MATKKNTRRTLTLPKIVFKVRKNRFSKVRNFSEAYHVMVEVLQSIRAHFFPKQCENGFETG